MKHFSALIFTFVLFTMPKSAAAQFNSYSFYQACGPEIYTYCPGANPLDSCMYAHQSDLSDDCWNDVFVYYGNMWGWDNRHPYARRSWISMNAQERERFRQTYGGSMYNRVRVVGYPRRDFPRREPFRDFRPQPYYGGGAVRTGSFRGGGPRR